MNHRPPASSPPGGDSGGDPASQPRHPPYLATPPSRRHRSRAPEARGPAGKAVVEPLSAPSSARRAGAPLGGGGGGGGLGLHARLPGGRIRRLRGASVAAGVAGSEAQAGGSAGGRTRSVPLAAYDASTSATSTRSTATTTGKQRPPSASCGRSNSRAPATTPS